MKNADIADYSKNTFGNSLKNNTENFVNSVKIVKRVCENMW